MSARESSRNRLSENLTSDEQPVARAGKKPRSPARLRCEVPVRIPRDPVAYAAFEAAVLAVVPGRRYDNEQTAKQRRCQLRLWADADAWRRYTNTAFGFFEFCGESHCKRAGSCAGNPHACFRMIWPHVDEDFKFQLRALAHGIRQGLSKADASTFAAAALTEQKRYEERERQKACAVAAEPLLDEAASTTISRERSIARIRSL